MPSAAFTEGRQDRMGRALARLRGDTCVVMTPTKTKDASGASVTVLTDSASVSCQIVPALREVDRNISGGRITPEADFVVYMDRAATVGKGYTIRNARTGERYTVLNDPNEPSVRPQLTVAVKELK